MTTLSKDEVVRLAREAGYRADAKMHDHDYDLFLNFYTLCRAPLVAELEQAKKEVERLKKDLSTVDVILEECKMDWSGDVTQIKAEHAHGLLALQAERDDWKARALKAEQAGEQTSAVPVVEQLVEASTMLLSYTLACEGLLNAKPAGQIDIAQEAIAAGQKFIKENGK